ncbi:MAG: hypothetical protein J6N52_09620 [Clostridia bacterium]|nr:hypothetical protein [Clostridia bacterium]
MFKNFYTTRMSAKGKTLQTRFMKMRSDKEKRHRPAGIITALIFASMLAAAVISAAASDGFSPVRFLNGESAETVSAINVFNGNTGKRYVIDDKDDIQYIIENLQNADFKIRQLSVGYIGTGFNLEFIGNNGKRMDKVVINSDNTLRKDPFFYTENNSALCTEYLENIEYMLDKAPPKSGAFMVIPVLSATCSVIDTYIPITDEEYERCINDTNVLPVKKPANYGVMIYKNIEEYERYDSAPPSQALIELAKAKADYTVFTPDEIHDITAAEFSVTFDGETRVETLTDGGKLSELEGILHSARKSAMGSCPYSGKLELSFERGNQTTVYFAIDSCSNIILGTNGGYTISRNEKETILEMFPETNAWLKENGLF